MKYVFKPGDLMLVPDGDGWILGIMDDYETVRYDDFERVIGPLEGRGIYVTDVSPEAGRLIGRRFGSLDLAREALSPFLL